VQRDEIDPRYIIHPYYLRPEVAIGRVVLTSREHIIALEPLDKGLMGTLLRYPYEVRAEGEYFDEIQDVNHHARPGQTHRQPEVRTVRAGII
jgi:DNA end-binding protein Ku